MEKASCKNQVMWINCLKAIAIIAVVVDHTNGLLYSNRYIAQGSYFSVTLFILLSGYTTYLSVVNKNSNEIDISLKAVLRKILPLIKQYLFATFVVLIFTYRVFVLTDYINFALKFNISSPYYFILFFLQLKLITPLLLKIAKNTNKFKLQILIDIAILLFLFVVAAICINRTFILPVHGGGAYLFGGTYLPVYYMGMLINKYNMLEKISNKVKSFILVPLIVFWCIWIYLMANAILKMDVILQPFFGAGFNPPSANFIIFASITLVLFYSIFSLLEQNRNKISKCIVKVFAYVGRNSLYVFLYHLLVKDLWIAILNAELFYQPIIRIIVFISIVLLPCLIVSLVELIKTKINILIT